MTFVYACLVWVVMAIALGVGMVLCVKGSPWLLILSIAAFIYAVGKIGCATH